MGPLSHLTLELVNFTVYFSVTTPLDTPLFISYFAVWEGGLGKCLTERFATSLNLMLQNLSKLTRSKHYTCVLM